MRGCENGAEGAANIKHAVAPKLPSTIALSEPRRCCSMQTEPRPMAENAPVIATVDSGGDGGFGRDAGSGVGGGGDSGADAHNERHTPTVRSNRRGGRQIIVCLSRR